VLLVKKAFAYLAVIFMISACAPINSPELGNEGHIEGNQVAYGLLGPGPINYGVIRDDIDEYRYDGHINQSPSFRTLDRHRQDLDDDEDMIRSILIDEPGVHPGMIFIVGKDIWVNATIDAQNEKELEQKRIELERVLSRVMQRYDIHVRANNQ
jgi:hypothetical protein